jgi:ribosomal protein S18 acetylase RimI-like enzyme
MDVRVAQARDWLLLKNARLSALQDTPSAFGMSYQTAASYSDDQWKACASSTTGVTFWLAVEQDKAVGLAGGHINASGRYNLIAMWVEPQLRGSNVALQLVAAVKRDAMHKQHKQVYLEVSPDNQRAIRFYQKQGFSFIDEREPLDSNPQIQLQSMIWNSAS